MEWRGACQGKYRGENCSDQNGIQLNFVLKWRTTDETLLRKTRKSRLGY